MLSSEPASDLGCDRRLAGPAATIDRNEDRFGRLSEQRVQAIDHRLSDLSRCAVHARSIANNRRTSGTHIRNVAAEAPARAIGT
jgi:hypothetical protein